MFNRSIVMAFAAMLLAIGSAFAQAKTSDFIGTWNGVTQQGTKILLVVAPDGKFEVSSTRGSDKGTVKITGDVAELAYANGAAKFVLRRTGETLTGENVVGSRGATAMTFSK